jgi:hypothetical protein
VDGVEGGMSTPASALTVTSPSRTTLARPDFTFSHAALSEIARPLSGRSPGSFPSTMSAGRTTKWAGTARTAPPVAPRTRRS